MTQVLYVPGATNYYDPDENVIILDSNLTEHPDAHDHVLQHELGHADPRHQSFTGFLSYEFRHDIDLYFSTTDGVEAFRTYHDERDTPDTKYVIGNIIRSAWVIVMQPAGALVRAARGVIESSND